MTSTLCSSVRRFSQTAVSVFITDPNNLVGAALRECAQTRGIHLPVTCIEKTPFQREGQSLRVIFHTPRPLPDVLMMRPFDFLEPDDQKEFRDALKKLKS